MNTPSDTAAVPPVPTTLAVETLSFYPMVFNADEVEPGATLVLTSGLEFKLKLPGRPLAPCDDSLVLEIIRACGRRMVADHITRPAAPTTAADTSDHPSQTPSG